MKKSNAVLQELGQLYDFQKRLAEFQFKKRRKSKNSMSPAPKTAPLRYKILGR